MRHFAMHCFDAYRSSYFIEDRLWRMSLWEGRR